jgi:hypothetical protein
MSIELTETHQIHFFEIALHYLIKPVLWKTEVDTLFIVKTHDQNPIFKFLTYDSSKSVGRIDLTNEAINWFGRNIEGYVVFKIMAVKTTIAELTYIDVCFEYADEATLFKLTWC